MADYNDGLMKRGRYTKIVEGGIEFRYCNGWLYKPHHLIEGEHFVPVAIAKTIKVARNIVVDLQLK